ncbi:multiple epidermal growth factor-like domains protein 10 isoform X2 [Haliotis rubra]|uniref:multiple epidermal growth factor-like domains protein 10 isoform X2 n=1 Tax=Haliotis rubra TaxID=36100 RepID=UPI001EE5B2C4|nr:multiple epidermal growth factor-like domains protein 10 isoform X2 [Haliotis rubra]
MGFTVFFIFVFIGVGYCLECPKCRFASNINECVRHNETCSDFENECIGIVDEWKITMGCGTQKRCAYEALQANVDCRGTKPFGANDKCVVCCTGDTCNQRLEHVQKGLDLVPKVLHCPVCSDETDPQKCLDNIQPCQSSSLTCEIIKLRGKYTSSCAVTSTCVHDHKLHPGIPDCLHDPRPCSVCCNDFSCIDYVLGVPPTSPFITPGIVPGGDNSSTSSTTTAAAASNNPLTAPPMSTCRDDTLFPCHTAVGAACTDPDISINFCPLSCGVCQVSATPAATMAATTTTATRPPQLIQCPSCHDASNIHDCLASTKTCHHSNEVCEISVSKWHIKAGCKDQLECSAAGSRSTTNCTDGGAFGPSDSCSVCCTGDDCRTSLTQIQKGFDAIPQVLHCPTCHKEADPQTCLETFGPCDSHHGTCELVLEHGLFSAKCESSQHCLHGVTDCDHDTGKCTTCCHDYACINRTLSLDATPLPQAPSTQAMPSLSPTPAKPCKDKDLFPCHISATGTACTDATFASEFCPLTCGVCKVATTTAITTHIPKEKCKDSTLYPCVLNVASTCPDPDLALLFCPLTCGLCEAGTDMTSPATSPGVTESTVEPSGQPGVTCPVCKDAASAKECLGRKSVCKRSYDVCKVTMKDWHVTAGCSHSKYCTFQQDHRSTINCTGGGAYGPP